MIVVGKELLSFDNQGFFILKCFLKKSTIKKLHN